MAVWNEVLTGIVLVAGGYWIIKTIYQWRLFRRSIYTEIYSAYIEYAFRKKNLVRLSESYYLKNELGKHRIVYQIVQAKGEKNPQAYILLLVSTGIYIINVKNQRGTIHLKCHGDKESRRPMDESRFFAKRMRQRIGEPELPLRAIVVFPEKSELIWEGPEDQEIMVVKRKGLIEAVKNDMASGREILSESRIDEIYHFLADESIEMERNM